MKPRTLAWRIQTTLREWLAVPRDATLLGADLAELRQTSAEERGRLTGAIAALNQTMGFLADVRRRVDYYEKTVPDVQRAKAEYDQQLRDGVLVRQP